MLLWTFQRTVLDHWGTVLRGMALFNITVALILLGYSKGLKDNLSFGKDACHLPA